MGLFSDYLEECRERDWDPLLLQPGMFFYPIQQQTKALHSNIPQKNTKHRSKTSRSKSAAKRMSPGTDTTKKILLTQASELESLKSVNLLAEKNLLALVNSQQFKSKLAQDKLDRLLNNLKESYRMICDRLGEIYREVGDFNVTIRAQSEDAVKVDLFRLLMDSFIYSLRNPNGAPFDTSSLRKVVADMATMIRFFQGQTLEKQDKKVVYHFLVGQCGISQSHHQCQNCGRFLLDDIPYCLNCYERN